MRLFTRVLNLVCLFVCFRCWGFFQSCRVECITDNSARWQDGNKDSDDDFDDDKSLMTALCPPMNSSYMQWLDGSTNTEIAAAAAVANYTGRVITTIPSTSTTTTTVTTAIATTTTLTPCKRKSSK